MNAGSTVLLLVLLETRIGLAIECLQCYGDFRGVKCTETCSGQQCVVWKWKTKSEVVLRQGCLTGVDRRFTAKVGCRTNMLGASMCICDDGDRCNTANRTDTTLRPLPLVRLPIVDCNSRVTGTGVFGSKRKGICTANYCHMMKTETYSTRTAPDVVSVYDCGDEVEFDFDVRLRNTVRFPALYPNGCYRIQTRHDEAVTDCTCSKNHCNAGIPVVIPGPVRCYIGIDTTNDTEVDPHHFCDGDYCFIQKHNNKYTKGCISVNERNTWSHLRNGHRHVVGVDQWLCQGHLCNFGLERMMRSLQPHTARSRSLNTNGSGYIRVFTGFGLISLLIIILM